MLDVQDRKARTTSAAGAESSVAPAPPCAMVIFGASGDLTKRLVVPALYNLAKAGQLSEQFQLIGFDHNAKSAEQWRDGLTETMNEFVGRDGEFQVGTLDQKAWGWLSERMSYLTGDLNDRSAYRKLGEHLA